MREELVCWFDQFLGQRHVHLNHSGGDVLQSEGVLHNFLW